MPDAAAELEVLRTELTAARRQLAERDRHPDAARDREALLRGELEHRIRNTQALVRSVFTRTVETAVSVEELGMHFSGRLDVLARYQLPRPGGAPDRIDLEGLIRDEFQGFAYGYGPGISIEGPDVALTDDQAQPFALAIHELVTNSLKFGALSVIGSSLSVTWTVTGETLDLLWLETGVPMITSAPFRRGFGREFIEDALPYQIGAATQFELRPGGVLCRISLPLANKEARAGTSAA